MDFIIPIAHAATEAATHAAPDTSIVGLFGLNAKVFIAQLINFAIVLFVLWKWVFGPITKKLDDRASMIEKSVQDAETIAKEKQEFQKWRQQEISSARVEAARIITDSKTEAEAVKNEVLEVTKSEQRKIIADTQEELRKEKNKAVNEAKNEVATMVVSATEKILKGKLSPEEDFELVKKSIKEVIK
ncbi:MAG TPA: F0F1 ATP synthase subunit B [Patescibacteria group bacterium]|nr:F0F1 ATP synthase subunit B [Patescibacteria group bacterium]